MSASIQVLYSTASEPQLLQKRCWVVFASAEYTNCANLLDLKAESGIRRFYFYEDDRSVISTEKKRRFVV